MICSMKYDASVDLWSVGVILYGKSHRWEFMYDSFWEGGEDDKEIWKVIWST